MLKLRSSLGLYANLRPAIIHKALSDASPIKPEIIGDSLDILVVRELTGGIYFGSAAIVKASTAKKRMMLKHIANLKSNALPYRPLKPL